MHSWSYADSFAGMSAAIQFLLALLGIAASQQDDWARRNRWSLLVGFVVLGLAGIFTTIAQSAKTGRDSAKAGSDLSTALSNLSSSTAEISRVTSLNTQLQQKLLHSGDTILQLTRENQYQITGEKGYCTLVPAVAEENANGLPLEVIGSKYPVYDVVVNIHEQATAGDSPEIIFQKARTAIVLNLGNVGGQYFHHIGYNLPVQRGKNNRFQINIFSRSGLFTEYLVVTWNEGRWNVGIDLGRNGTNTWIVKTPKDFPYLKEP